MGKYSVPESIRKYKPKGHMVKKVGGKYYYVYRYKSVKGVDGKRHTQMGKCVGSIVEGIGFIPNDSYNCDEEISSLDYGDYAVVLANSKKTYSLLQEFFNPADAVKIYLIAVIYFIQGFSHMKDVASYYEMSYLSVKYPSVKLGYTALASMFDSLGRRQGNILRLEEKLIQVSSHQIAIDGHVIPNCLHENDLCEKGYRFQKIGEPQINLLMAYDVNTKIPLLTKIFQGGMPDKTSVQDFINEVPMENVLYIVDRGFYSKENIELFTLNGNSYIMPLAKNLKICKKAVSDLRLEKYFCYKNGKKSSTIEYKDEIIDGFRVLTYRDINEAAALQTSYLQHIDSDGGKYTEESFMKNKDFFGVIVLQTSLRDESAQEIFKLYKKRWSIETFYNYFKNKADFSALYQQDYYKTQGLSFIMLVCGLIHSEMEKAVSGIKGKSVHDCLLEARFVKAIKRRGNWAVCNCKKKQVDLFKELNTPLAIQ